MVRTKSSKDGERSGGGNGGNGGLVALGIGAVVLGAAAIWSYANKDKLAKKAGE